MAKMNPKDSDQRELFGLLAEFASPEELLGAVEQARSHGYHKLDAFSPFPIEGLGELLGFESRGVQRGALCGGILGALGGYSLQYATSVVIYPINVGGRPLNSIPSFIPVTFELTVLCAAFGAVLTMLVLNGLPRLYHPVFNLGAFERASRDGFFLCIEQDERLKFEPAKARQFLQGLGARGVYDVEK